MPPAIFDIASLAARRRMLFGEQEPSVSGIDREDLGTAINHCGICPLPEHERCHLSCKTQRKALTDGVTVR